MKGTLGAICVLSLVAFTATAETLIEKTSSVDTIFNGQANSAADEAFQLGEILRSVARTLAEDNEFVFQNEEYFTRVMWEKLKSAISNASTTVKGTVMSAYDEAKNHISKAASDVKQKLKRKAAEILSKLIVKAIVGYAFEDSDSQIDFMKNLCEDIDHVGQRLMQQSKVLHNADI